MKLPRLRLLCIVTLLLALVACGGSSSGTAVPTTAASTGQGGPSASAPAAGTSLSPAGGPSPAAGSSRAGSIDVCALLSEADAAAVARERGLNGAQTSATKYTLKATTVPTTGSGSTAVSGCTFTIDGQGASGTIGIEVSSAENFAIYADGQKVAGLGDEAYRGGGQTVVRVGDLMLQSSENSFTDGFAVALYRKMIPHLK